MDEANQPEQDATHQTEFTFDQLDDRAKEAARDAWRERELNDEWWDTTYEDAVQIGKLVGIEIGTRSYNTHGGGTGQEPDIYFRLYTQGSGACFSGTLHIAQLDGCQARLAEEIGTTSDGDKALAALAELGQALYSQIVLRAFTRRLLGPDPADEGWGNINEVGLLDTIPLTGNDCYYSTCISNDHDYPEEIERAMNDYVAVFASWLYHQLEAECDYLYSEEYVDEEIARACAEEGLLFDEFGSTI